MLKKGPFVDIFSVMRMLSKPLILLAVMASAPLLASETEGKARLGTPRISARTSVGVASTRNAVVRSHRDLAKTNPWARSGRQAGYATIRPSKRVSKAVKARPPRKHVQLERSNAWAKPAVFPGNSRAPIVELNRPRPLRGGPTQAIPTPAQTVAAKPRPRTKAVTTNPPNPKTTKPMAAVAKISRKPIAPPPPVVPATPHAPQPRPTPVAVAKLGSPKVAKPTASPKTIKAPTELTQLRPEFLTDLNAMLSRSPAVPASPVSARTVSRSRATRVMQNPKGVIYTGPESVFDHISQSTAFHADEASENVPVDTAAQLFASRTVPATYHASIHGSPKPLNRNISAFKHNPLYFEERNLERCGNGYGCATTAVSAARFAGSTLALPILLLSEYPSDCVPGGPDCPTCTELTLP